MMGVPAECNAQEKDAQGEVNMVSVTLSQGPSTTPGNGCDPARLQGDLSLCPLPLQTIQPASQDLRQNSKASPGAARFSLQQFRVSGTIKSGDVLAPNSTDYRLQSPIQHAGPALPAQTLTGPLLLTQVSRRPSPAFSCPLVLT